jgi:putative hemolysin
MLPSGTTTRKQANVISRLAEAAGWKRVLLPQRRLQRLYESSQRLQGANIFEALLRALDVSYSVSPRGMELIPNAGAAVVVANHPFGMLDGILLGALLLRVRSDAKLVANQLLAGIPDMGQHCIYVDNMGGDDQLSVNTRGLRQAIRHLRKGGLVAFFPAGEVAHWSMRTMSISDAQWNDSAARLAEMTGAPIIPVSIQGANSLGFQLSGLIHPKLRTLQLPHELLNKRGQHVEVIVSPSVKAEKLRAPGDPETATSMLQWSTQMLSLAPACSRWQLRLPRPTKPVTRETDAGLIERELLALTPASHLCQQSEFDVYEFSAGQAPNVVREIGRLREISFRQIGEGTGRSVDLDPFDDYYSHLALWHRERRQIAGSYRLGNVRDILARFGPGGLYTSTLFRYQPSFFTSIDGAMELGRSFVRPEYQRHYLPLLMLWKGIGAYLVRSCSTPVLFGAVSVSDGYSPASRELIAVFLRAQMAPANLVGKVESKSPFRRTGRCAGVREQGFTRTLTLADVSERVASWETDRKDVPILVKHYLKLGGKTLALAVDHKFSNSLDALIMVDLRKSDPAVLSRYLGATGAHSFLDAARAVL